MSIKIKTGVLIVLEYTSLLYFERLDFFFYYNETLDLPFLLLWDPFFDDISDNKRLSDYSAKISQKFLSYF